MHQANAAKEKKIRRITQISSTPPLYRNTGTPYHLVDPLLEVSRKNKKLFIGHSCTLAKETEYKSTPLNHIRLQLGVTHMTFLCSYHMDKRVA